MLLARKGFRILLLDRATFPSEIARGHLLHQHGPRRLASWSLLDALLATGCPPITSITVDCNDFPLTGDGLVVNGVPAAVGPRRSRLDKVLVDAAVDAGVELREGFAVHEFTTDSGRITGVRGGRAKTGGLLEERATLVVGADGRNSLLARAVAAPKYRGTETIACYYWSYWASVPVAGLEIYFRGGRAVFAHPTNDDLTALIVGWPIAEFVRVRSDIERALLAVVDCVPDLAERVRQGDRVERYYGAAQLPNFLRKPQGPGWALVGDAGCHKDPLLALGVCDALRDAELLADAVSDGLSGGQPLEKTLAEYQRQRDEATLADYHRNLDAARMQPLPPEGYAFRAGLRGAPHDITQFFLARQGMIPREAFFNEENTRRIKARGVTP